MPDLTLILLGAGNSSRFGIKAKKQWLRCEDEPLWLFLANRLKNRLNINNIIIVANKNEISYMKNFADFTYVEGGSERQLSLKNAIEKVETEYVMVSDVARVCLDDYLLQRLMQNINKADIIVPYLGVADTVHYQDKLIDRNKVKLIQTPQISRTKTLQKALESEKIFTDDSSAVLATGGSIKYIKGSNKAIKLTYFNDLNQINCLKPPSNDTFCGLGYDVHRFADDKKMFLGGVEIDVPYGFEAHSDGDVALHALCDALLGAIGYGDIGELFPDNDKKYKNIDSKELLKKVVLFLYSVGYKINNIDLTIIAQKPKITPYKEKMKKTISTILQIPTYKINIKATTTEKMGFIGRGEGVATQAIVGLGYFDWSKEIEK